MSILGCGSDTSSTSSSSSVASTSSSGSSSSSGGMADAAALTLTSPEFENGGTLAKDHTCDGAGTSPPLLWTGVPSGTVEFALLMTTIAPDGLKWNWVLYHVPANVSSLPAGAMGVGTAGLTSDGPNLAYSPPCSQGPGLKTYTFTLYALSAAPSFSGSPSQVTGTVVTDAVANTTLAKSEISVGYTRP